MNVKANVTYKIAKNAFKHVIIFQTCLFFGILNTSTDCIITASVTG